MLNKRSRMILLEVIKQKSLSIETLAKQLHVSQRTIRMDLEDIDYFLLKKKLTPLIRPGKQEICMKQNEATINLLYELINTHSIVKASYLPEERLLEELYSIAMSTIPRKSEMIATEMDVSKSTIAKDFERLKEIISEEKFYLQGTLDGMRLVGREFEIRRGVVNLFIHSMDKSDTVDMSRLLINGNQKVAYRVYWHLFEGVNLNFIQECIHIIEIMLVIQLSDVEFLSLGAHLCMMYKRIEMACLLDDFEENSGELKDIINILFDKFKKQLNMDIPNCEKNYLLYALQVISIDNFLMLHTLNEEKIACASRDFIKEMLIETKNNITYHQSLDERIQKEIKFILAQRHLRIPIRKNVVMIREECYKLVFQQVCNVASKLPMFKAYKKNELWLLTYHFIDYQRYDKNISKKRVLIVSNKAKSLTNILKERLLILFDIEVVACVGVIHFPSILDSIHIDIVISTLRLDACVKPNVLVHPLMNEHDIKRLKACLKTHQQKLKSNKVQKNIFIKEVYGVEAADNNIEDILYQLFMILKAGGCVLDDYLPLLKECYHNLTWKTFFSEKTIVLSVQIQEVSKADGIAVIHLKNPMILLGCNITRFIALSTSVGIKKTEERLKYLHEIRIKDMEELK